MEGFGFEPITTVHGIMQLYISQKYTKKYMKGFGLVSLDRGSGSCFKDQVEWCLGRPTEL
jgi:hypothetical protein